MNWYSALLLLHLIALVAAFYTGGIATSAMFRVYACADFLQALSAFSTAQRAGSRIPIFLVVLVITGGAMVQSRWAWTTPWIDVALLGALALFAIGGGVIASHERAIHKKLTGTRSHAMALELLRDRVIARATGANEGLALAMIFIMVMKPGLAVSLLALAALGIGGALAMGALTSHTLAKFSLDTTEAARA